MAEKRRFINNTDIGQNFLIDESVVAYTVKRAAVTPDDVLLEIGPGGGILTRGLLSAGPRALCAVEVDERLRDGLEALASRDGRLRLFWGDAVRFDYRAELPETPTKIVANLPYHITTPILWAFLEKKSSDYVVRCSLESFSKMDRVVVYPLYAAGNLLK